MAKL
jgi:hypothetical protein